MDKRTHKERHEAGLKTRREVLGAAYVDKAQAAVDDFNLPFTELLNTYCWNDIWNRPGLPRKTRSLLNLAGKAVDGAKYPVNIAGFVIHSAIHEARDDAHCIIHTHSTAGSAVACKKDGLRYDNFYSAILHGEVAYHEFEGVTTDTAEQSRLIASLGRKSVLLLRNHGLLVACPGIPEAFTTYWTLQRACEIQAATDAMTGDNLPITQRVLDETPARTLPFRGGPRPGGMAFDGLLRRAGIRYEDLV